MTRRCTVVGCPGSYEERRIVHLVEYEGQPVAIEDVPAEVCSVCGDILFMLETVERIQALLRADRQPARTIPLYEYAAAA